MLTFTEEVLLLLLHEGTGRLLPLEKITMNRVMSASALMELAFADRIDTDLEQLIIVNCEPVGIPVLDQVLQRIAGSNEIKDTKAWMDILTVEAGTAIRNWALGNLVEQGYLEHRVKKLLWVFKLDRYYPITSKKTKIQNENVKKRIMSLLFFVEEIPEPRDLALICLVDACDILLTIFEERELNRIRPRLEQMRKIDLIGREMLGQIAVWKLGYRKSEL